MLFWAMRFLLLLLAFPALFFRWRVGLVVFYALLVDFVTLVGMTLPTFGVWGEFLLVFPVSLVLGGVLILGKDVDRIPLLACLAILVCLHFSTYVGGLSNGVNQATVILERLPALGMLLLAVGAGIALPFEARRLVGRRSRRNKVAPS
jgi:hypothetical protein